MYKVGLYTLGCKVSLYETEAIAEAFEKEGFEISDFDSVCDAYVINTCTVTAESDAKSRKYIRRAARKNPEAVVAVVGCYSQREPEAVAGISGVSVVLGTADKLSVVKRVKELLDSGERRVSLDVFDLSGAAFEPMKIERAPRTRAYVKIEDGCECRCTYCAISAARGPVRSKPRCDVISEVEALSLSGVKEVVLTGIETGSWGADFKEKYGLAELLTELDARGSCKRVRLGSMAPELVNEDFIKKIAPLKIMTPHIHLSVQSASSYVLKRMKRRYNADMLYRNVELLRQYVPNIQLTADLMVGFPGESEDDFLKTLEFVGRAELLDAHVFAYSAREGTPAAEYDGQIPESVKQQRSRRLIEEKNRVREAVLDAAVKSGAQLNVIFETENGGYYTGHSDSYIEVMCHSERDVRGELLSVMPTGHENGVLYGKIIN
ncbi:MAG: tRNA (N(6)-L-threonylcarbamoyladenosine(37)-C(2))-methylthiotransferase MtaB [Clostridia bacterium]|nr:tRNA (N(6)-L-threonylcarbamoyladenosine(37)-C(2))-methylthiotransferase MtaB [Clostridia bacterium]